MAKTLEERPDSGRQNFDPYILCYHFLLVLCHRCNVHSFTNEPSQGLPAILKTANCGFRQKVKGDLAMTETNVSEVSNVEDLKIGLEIEFDYPRHNYFGAIDKLEHRSLLIESIRDTKLEPVESEFIAFAHTLKRGRFLITGIDLAKGCQT